MARQYKIRWGRSDYAKLSHLVRKINKKIEEITSARPDIAEFQPEPLVYKDLKAEIMTRKDFNYIMKKYERYLQPGVEETVKSKRGAVSTKWQVREFSIAQATENRRRARQRDLFGNVEITISGVGQGVTRAQMGTIKENELKPSKKKFDNMSKEDWKRAFRLMEEKMYDSYHEKKRILHFDNYIKGLYTTGLANENLIDIMNHIPYDVFLNVFIHELNASYEFIYDPIEVERKRQILTHLWGCYYAESTDNGLKWEGYV